MSNSTASNPAIDMKGVDLFLPSSRKLASNIEIEATPIGGKIVSRRGRHYVHALRDVTLSIKAGDRVGLIGHNGAGKTSLMRLMCDIYQPTSGQCDIRGSVSALFSSTIGMDVNATGLENIRFAATLYGIPKEKIDDVIADVREFSELGDYLNMTTRSYSAGMKMRLGFSIVTSVRPEILIIDEVLTTGDQAFAEKAQKRILDFAERAKILIVASHSYGLLSLFCKRGIWMNRGSVKMDGDLLDVWQSYSESQAKLQASANK